MSRLLDERCAATNSEARGTAQQGFRTAVFVLLRLGRWGKSVWWSLSGIRGRLSGLTLTALKFCPDWQAHATVATVTTRSQETLAYLWPETKDHVGPAFNRLRMALAWAVRCRGIARGAVDRMPPSVLVKHRAYQQQPRRSREVSCQPGGAGLINGVTPEQVVGCLLSGWPLGPNGKVRESSTLCNASSKPGKPSEAHWIHAAQYAWPRNERVGWTRCSCDCWTPRPCHLGKPPQPVVIAGRTRRVASCWLRPWPVSISVPSPVSWAQKSDFRGPESLQNTCRTRRRGMTKGGSQTRRPQSSGRLPHLREDGKA